MRLCVCVRCVSLHVWAPWLCEPVRVLSSPAVCVAVAVHVTLARAARGRTLEHVLMHGQD